MSKLVFSYYADDFTGATDALECLCRAGIKTVLFTRPPSGDCLSRFQDVEAIGVAGTTRSMAPDDMEKELSTVFSLLVKLGAPHIHYKVCSTFDSSPETGSIGCAVEVGRRTIGSSYVPLVVGVPQLDRYCLFGNLYAAASIGSDSRVYRLDRHPTASRHPSTPMRESDLLAHLARQTDLRSALFDVRNYEDEPRNQSSKLEQLIGAGAEVVLFDVLNEAQLTQIGRLIESAKDVDRPQFSVGSSAIEYAMTAFWSESGKLSESPSAYVVEPTSQTLVVSGSCSPVTESQIDWALRNGFQEVALDTAQIASSNGNAESLLDPTSRVVDLLRSGESVIVHASRGIDDPRISATLDVFRARGDDKQEREELAASILGRALGSLTKSVLEKAHVDRVCFCGGDTSSIAAHELGIEAMEMVGPLSIGAPVCAVSAPGSPADEKEFVFKGGQVGQDDFFGLLLIGTHQPNVSNLVIS